MRTLKKSLALVLALVMVLGLAVVGASADNAIDKFEDSDQIGDAYLEAVGVLTGLAIVDGMTDTEIAPQGTYQRDQAAKIIAYMVLGKEAADSLVASYAPFQDVPADYWAAGYIAFCKEQGIIDGVSDTSFDPYGTLTGFQWAKMLLAAVGFNANNELEGDSWSLNTARTGHEVGLFDGDIAGADHVALRREQAMLYAFNTLTNVRQVSYTGNGNNYVYDIVGYEWADGTGYTLGYDVFDLKFVEGQIVDNEGMGNSKTVVANANYEKNPTDAWWWDEFFGSDDETISVNADTGLDLMYHAVRVWYTGSNTNGTNVYVNDLATVTTYECMNMATGDDDVADLRKDKKTVGTADIGEVGQEYEAYLIDNTALDLSNINKVDKAAVNGDYAYVTLWADYATKNFAGKDETTLTSNVYANAKYVLDNDDIKTDISEISNKTEVIYVQTASTINSSNVAEYLYPVTTTEGVVTKVSKSDDGVVTLTLSDDTTLELSVFWDDVQDEDALDFYALRQNYLFVLDTHGDVIYATKDGARDLYYYTGDSRWDTEHGSWNDVRVYRFVHVTTGEELIIPTTDKPTAGEYYDVRVTPNTNGAYVITNVNPDNVAKLYANEYVLDNFNAVARGDYYVATGAVTGEKVYFDLDTITFKVLVGSGDDMTVETYEGIDELAEDYPNAVNSEYTFSNACFTVTGTYSGGKYATTLFVDEDNFKVTGNYLFVPEDVSADNWSDVESGNNNTYVITYNGAYLDGVKNPVEIRVDASDVSGDIDRFVLKRGFYKWVLKGGVYTIYADERIDDGKWCAYDDVDWDSVSADNNHWVIWNSNISNEVDAYSEDVLVVDLTGNWDVEDDPSLADVYDYLDLNKDLRLAYTVNAATGDVNVIYIVDDQWHNSVSVVDKLDDWTIVAGGYKSDVAENGKVTVPVSLKYTGTAELGTEEITFTIGGKDYKATANASTGLYTFDVETSNVGWNNVKLDLTAANFVVNVTNESGNNGIALSWTPEKVAITGTTNVVVTVSATAEEGYRADAYYVKATVEGQEITLSNPIAVEDGVVEFTVSNVVAWGNVDIVITYFSSTQP